MIGFWQAHIGWRFVRTSTHERQTRKTVVLRELPPDSGSCAKCHRARDDARFKLCRRCRTRAAIYQKKRRTRRLLTGGCSKCGRARDSDHLICTTCRASERARYHARGGANQGRG